MKFGIVGVIAAVIDFGVLNLFVVLFHMSNVLAATLSFLISLCFNYLASMKFVFKHREDMARWMEILIFILSAVIGLLLNDLIIWISTSMLPADAIHTQHARYVLFTNIGKLVATVVVAVWNFIIRKWLLDDTHTNAMNRLRSGDRKLDEAEMQARRDRSFSHRLGVWSLEHSPFGWK